MGSGLNNSLSGSGYDSMQNLVTSPIQPLQGMPFSCNRDYLNTAPSSSHHNSESRDALGKKGKRNRAMDSDSEVEREKKRRGREDSRSFGLPGSSRIHQPSDNSYGLRALFGGNSDRKDPPDKGISPDSGIHSAENDPGDENDVHSAQTIINLITRLSPPLSPIKERPIDKKVERERREAELRERDRLERLERERKEKEERELQEKEQAEREERVKQENERLECERKERERKGKEREEKERKEKEREEREREERREKERDERTRREQDEKLRKDKEDERLRREIRKQKEKERNSHCEKKSKELIDRTDRSLERKERRRPAESDKSETSLNERKRDDCTGRSDGLRGEIILRGLDRLKLKQLVEIGRKTGRLKEEWREDGREVAEAKEDKRKEKKEREKKFKDRSTVEDALRKKLASAKSSPCLPRASSSQSNDDPIPSHSRPSSTVSNHPARNGFECAANECAPTRPVRPVKPEEGSTELLYDFYHSIAKSRKRKGDAEADKVARVLLYLDAAAYFILSAKHFNPPDANENRANRQYSIIRDTGDLLK